MGIFDKIKDCKILKENSDIEHEILELKEMMKSCPNSEKIKFETAIRNLEYGSKGENAILFELKNSGIPMLVLHDLYLEHEELSAQIDFMILTRDKVYILESKNMYGDVTVNNRGDFYRKINGISRKIYSPITQCDRHVELIKKIRYHEKTNIVAKAFFEKYGGKGYCSLVVIANPTAKINTKYAPREIKNKIVSVDQLVRFIKMNHNSKGEISEKIMIELGVFFLSAHKENPRRYLDKYKRLITDVPEEAVAENKGMIVTENIDECIQGMENIITCSVCGNPMVRRVAKRGGNIGEEFYGCSQFPECRNTKKI